MAGGVSSFASPFSSSATPRRRVTPISGWEISPAPKENAHLYLVPVPKELLDTSYLGCPVVVRYSRAETHFAYDVGLLSLSGLAVPLGLRVAEAPVVQEPADGRACVGRNLYQVHTLVAGHVNGLKRRNDAQLLTGVSNDPDLSNTYLLVNAVVSARDVYYSLRNAIRL